MDNEILTRLQNDPWFRERANKNLGIAEMLKEKYNLDIEVNRLKAVIEDANSMDRYWRLNLDDDHFPELRGKDYETKKKVVQEAQVKLGYESGYNVLKSFDPYDLYEPKK